MLVIIDGVPLHRPFACCVDAAVLPIGIFLDTAKLCNLTPNMVSAPSFIMHLLPFMFKASHISLRFEAYDANDQSLMGHKQHRESS